MVKVRNLVFLMITPIITALVCWWLLAAPVLSGF